jgi:N-acyl-D-aspartate/D-glutamate deacylase
MSDHDIVIRGGTVVDGTGGPSRSADVAIDGERISLVGEVTGKGTREIDARDRIVTPGFVDIHTHLDGQLAWDPMCTSSCWHGVTSVVMGNCGVTFAPVQPGGSSYLAEVMESVEDIPAASILSGLPWNWSTFGEYLDAIETMPKGINVGGMVGHVAVRWYVMGEDSLGEAPASPKQVQQMADLVDEALRGGALGFSTSRTLGHRVPDGRPVPGTYADDNELLAIGDVLGRLGRGVFESAPRFEHAGPDGAGARHEVQVLAEITRRTGRPSTFGLAQSNIRPQLYRLVLDEALEQNTLGARLRPQTTCRSIGIVFTLTHRSPWSDCRSWAALSELDLGGRLAYIRDPQRRAQLIADALAEPPRLDPTMLYFLEPAALKYRQGPDESLGAQAKALGVDPVELFLDRCDATDGRVALNMPILNQSFDAIEDMLASETVVLGLADAGAHVGQIMDASQATYFLSHWVRDTGFFKLEEGVRRLTSDTASLFGLDGRGVLAPGAYADINVIDIDGLGLAPPEYVHDFPGGAGRYIQRGQGYDATLVNGVVALDHGEHTGAFVGHLLRSS